MSAARERRNRQNVYTLTGALLASLAIVLVVVILSIRPDPATRPEVDWHDIHASAPNSEILVDPSFSASDGDWWANRAEYVGGANPEWVIGLVTPKGEYVSVEQFVAGVPPEVAELLDDVEGKPRTIAGTTWTEFDRSALETPGNYERVLEFTVPAGGTLIVSGTAEETELFLAAERALASVKG